MDQATFEQIRNSFQQTSLIRDDMNQNDLSNILNRGNEANNTNRAKSIQNCQLNQYAERLLSMSPITSRKNDLIDSPSLGEKCLNYSNDRFLKTRCNLIQDIDTGHIVMKRQVGNDCTIDGMSDLESRAISLHNNRILGNQKRRKARTVFTDTQLNGLEGRFEVQRYLSTPERYDLAGKLNLSETQVKTW